MEEAWRESEARYRALLDQANDAIFLLLDGIFVDCNAKGLEMYGRTREQILGRMPDAFSPPTQPDGRDSQEKGLEIFHKVLAGESQFFEWLSCLPDGTPLYTEVSLNRLELSGKIYIQAIVRDITERKRSEENNVRSLALLRATLDSTADGILTIGADRQILSYNDAFVKMWRIPADVLATNNDDLAIQCVLSQLQTPEHFLAKVHYLYDHPLEESFDVLDFKDGRVFERFSRPMLVEGHPIGRVWSFRDVTERKRAEQAMFEGEVRFQTLVDQSPVAIGISRNGTGLYANQRFLHIFGLKSIEEFIGRHVSDYFAPEFQEVSRERIRLRSRGLPAPNEFESIGLRSDGSLFPLHVIVAQVTLADGMAEIGFLTDITDRKRAEAQIAEQAAFLDKARDAIVVRDLGGTILFWNKGAERVYGWTRQEVVGRNVLEILHADSKAFEEINRLTISQEDWIGELQHQTKDQREITIEVRCSLIRDDEGRPKSILSINTDVTEKKKIEAQFMRAQRMESIGALAGGVAHDLNNILAPIMMSIVILKSTSTNPKAAKILDSIEVSAKRGADILRQLLTFARGLEGQRSEVQPKQLLNDLEIIIKDTFPKNIQLRFSIPNEVGSILGDPTQVHQILLNLCLNARDAMPNGGSLAIGVENCVLDEQQDIAMPIEAQAGRYVMLRVTDSGMGMSQDVLDKIFEPFFTTKELNKGTGLGLSTVMAIVKSHDGFIHVCSEPGKGTTFKVYLPAMESSSEAGREQAEEDSLPHGHGEMILIVDDEASNLAVTSHTLEAFGYRTLSATDGAEALAIYEQFGDDISVVLTDMAMPVMDGAATIRTLLKINPAIRIIASSGSVAKEPDIGVRCFLAKPYTAETLLKTLRTLLDEDANCE